MSAGGMAKPIPMRKSAAQYSKIADYNWGV
jgi:hypothetical protein